MSRFRTTLLKKQTFLSILLILIYVNLHIVLNLLKFYVRVARKEHLLDEILVALIRNKKRVNNYARVLHKDPRIILVISTFDDWQGFQARSDTSRYSGQ